MRLRNNSNVLLQLEDGGSDGTRTLHILGAEYHHSGDISCQIGLESHPDLIQQTSSTHLAVLPIAAEAKDNKSASNDTIECSPRFIRGPSDSTALSGSTVTLEAFFRGTPEPYIKWIRGVSFYPYFL